MPVPSQDYDSCYPFVWYVWAFDFAIWLGTFLFFPRRSVLLWFYFIVLEQKTRIIWIDWFHMKNNNLCIICAQNVNTVRRMLALLNKTDMYAQ